MQLRNRIFLLITSIVTILMLGTSILAQGGTASLRFVHVIPGLTAIDVYVNGSLTHETLDFGQNTNYVSVPAGTANVRVTLAGLTTTLWEETLNAPDAEALTYIASSTNPIGFTEFRDDLTALEFGTSRLLVINAIENSPELDIQVSGDAIETQTIISGMGYGGTVGPTDVPSASYRITVVTTGDEGEALLTDIPAPISSGTSNILVIYGPASGAQSALITAPVSANSDDSFVRFAHGVNGAPSVDVVVDGSIVVPSLSFGEMSAHIPVPSGSKAISLQVAGSGTDAASATVELEALSANTVAALGTTDELLLNVFTDDLSGIAARTALVNVINTVADSSTASISLADGTELVTGVAVNESSGAVQLEATVADLDIQVDFGEAAATAQIPSTAFYGGVFYNVLILTTAEGIDISVAPTSLLQTINSAPNATDFEVAVEPTEVPTEVAAVTTPEPTTAPEATQPPATVTETETEGPTARVAVDPGVNLQLREYPNSEAKSLGLAPSGAILQVNGREGAPIDIDGNVIPLEDGTEWVDPAIGLAENEDLVPSDTWINVTYPTPDGGSITAWVNTLYLDIRDEEGEVQRLADLETIPINQPGTRTNTEITPPPPADDSVQARVFNLNAGVQLNIRRTPETTGEVLARVSAGTSLEFLGLGQSGEWVFVQYNPEEGGSVTGWVSQTYVEYLYRGELIDLEEMEARGLLTEADEETAIGERTANAPALVQPTVDPFKDAFAAEIILDPGARLNLRRTPDVQAEVLANIPAGERVVVLSRTADSEWLEASFDGVTGWIASQFVAITFNGISQDVQDIPINTNIGNEDTDESTAG